MVRTHARSFASVVLAAFTACATTSTEPLPPGDDLEGGPEAARTVRDPRGNERIPTDRQPTQDELAGAFDTPEAPTATARGTLSGSGTISTEGPEDPLQARRADFAARQAEVKRLVSAKDPGALDAAQDLERRAEGLEPALTTSALKLGYEAARALEDEVRAQVLGRRWLLSCGPTQPDRCRREAFTALARVLGKKGQSTRARSALDDSKRADACLRQVEAASWKKGVPPPGCADEALRIYRNQGDGLQAIRLYAARARIKAQDEQTQAEAERDFRRAATECTQARCAEVRQKALERLAWLHLRQNEPDPAAKAALQAVALHASSLPIAQRPWAWTEVAQKACAAYDQKAGQGACRKLEKSVVGFHSFKDYSRQKLASNGLSMEQVKEVNAHYGVSLNSCLAEEAARLRPPAQERYTMRWVVMNDGRVAEMHMDRKDHDNGPLAQCFRQRLAVWRYPRYEGEYQHVEQTFAVSANRR